MSRIKLMKSTSPGMVWELRVHGKDGRHAAGAFAWEGTPDAKYPGVVSFELFGCRKRELTVTGAGTAKKLAAAALGLETNLIAEGLVVSGEAVKAA